MVQKHFMKLVTPHDHKFAALHGAVWSGGSFVYVPPGVKVEIPLQSYFRLNAAGAGQFEHTLIIVDEGADLHFIEGCSAPKYNVANLHAGCVELFVGKNAKLRYSTMMPDHCHFLRNLLSSASADSRIYFIENQCFDLVTICQDCLQGKHNSGKLTARYDFTKGLQTFSRICGNFILDFIITILCKTASSGKRDGKLYIQEI